MTMARQYEGWIPIPCLTLAITFHVLKSPRLYGDGLARDGGGWALADSEDKLHSEAQ